MKRRTRSERFPDEHPAVAGRSHFVIERWGTGWAVTIRRRGRQPETILAATPGEVNRIRRELSENGLIGWNPRAA